MLAFDHLLKKEQQEKQQKLQKQQNQIQQNVISNNVGLVQVGTNAVSTSASSNTSISTSNTSAISSALNIQGVGALAQLCKLRGCQVHSTVMLSEVDQKVFKKLGVDLTCDPVKKSE